MGFWTGMKFCYREAWAFVLACPLLFLVPVAAEILQHVVEMQIGMYDSAEAAVAADADPLRLAFGFVKVLALLLPAFWVTRFVAGGRDAAAARTIEQRALALFVAVFLFQAISSAIQLFGIPRTGSALLIAMALGMVINTLLMRWMVAAPLGIFITPAASIRAMAPQLVWAVAFSIAVILPLMAPHYALGAGAIFAPEAAKWPILILDSLLVGYLSAVMVASTWVIATRRSPIAAPESA